MHIKSFFVLLTMFFLVGCSVFKKNKTPDQVTTPLKVVSDTFLVEGPASDSNIWSLVVPDTVVAPVPPKAPLEYMTIEEKAMIDEINILRSDPNAYIRHIDAYLMDYMEDDNWDYSTKQAERNAAEEVMRALKSMPPLPLVAPSEALYKVAMAHGVDMKEHAMISHRGSDGSLPEDRIRDSTNLIGSENLAAGGRSMRESLIMLLVDANDRAARNHRKTILNPAWEFVACYYAGTVSELPQTWVQLFAYKDPNDVPKITTIRSLPKDELNKKTETDPILLTLTEKDTEENTKVADDKTSDKQDKKSKSKATSNTKSSPAAGDFSFMSGEEKSMIDEINLMRSNPKGYIKHVDAFIAAERGKRRGNTSTFDKYSKELKKELRKTKKLSQLRPHKKLYEVAKEHGLYNKRNHQMEHLDANGGEGFDRVEKTGLKNSINKKGEYAPNENLVGGYASIRDAVIYLLIDEGQPDRGHRKALLEPTWEYVACYKVGMVEKMKDDFGRAGEDMPHNWIQFFAIGSAIDKSNTETSQSGSNPSATNGNATASKASGDFSFMTTVEKSMIDEVNLMRSNPKAYLKHLDAYVAEQKSMGGTDSEFDAAVRELKSQLGSMAPLSRLRPHKKLYEVAEAHGIDNKIHHQLEHNGSDGRNSFARVRDSGLKNNITWTGGSGDFAPNENLATGRKQVDVRESVLLWLIDAGISGRGHRKALLEPAWKYIACYNIGTITTLRDYVEAGKANTDAPNCWVQIFAKD